MNEPGQSNGLIEVWIDGKKNSALSKDQLRFTTADTIGINRLWADIHYGGQYESPALNAVYLDDFHVSTGPTPWSGPLGVASKWSGTVVVDGDVTVPAEVTLTVAKGTQVRFLAGTDETGGGTDKTKSELIVAGTLDAGAGNITFRSTNADPDAAEWYGIRVLNGGTANLTNATLQDGVKCVQSAGTLTLSNTRFSDCGGSEWSGTVVVNGDVTVPAGMTLTVAKGTQVRFLAGTDDTGSGTDKTKSELIVAGTLNAGAGDITFRSTNADPDAAEWYGIRVLKGGTADLTNATLQDGVKCVQSAGTLTLSNTRFSDCGLMTGGNSVSYAENDTTPVDTYQAFFLEGVSYSWTLSGVDASAFQVKAGGPVPLQSQAPSGPRAQLGFRSAPDFESPTDQGQDGTYEVRLQATGRKKSSGSGEAIGQAPPVAPVVTLVKDVTVTVTNGEEPGTVSVSSSQPKVGDHLTATLSLEPDGFKTGTDTWSWRRLPPPSGSASTSDASGELSKSLRYTVQPSDLASRLVAQVSYADSHGSGKSASDTTAAVAAGPPGPPASLTATGWAKKVGLRWAAADSHGSWISGYSVRDSTSGGQWSAWRSVGGGGSARDTTMTGLTDGRRYWFGVRAKNPVGSGPADTVSALAQTPTLTGPDSISYAENATDTVATYRLTPTPGGGAFSWSLAGADSSAFTGGDTLRFVRSPDYEDPADGDRNNLYALNVRAVPSAKGFSPLSKSVKVKVRDVDETGTITLSRATPRVGQPITATLSDPDSVESVDWWRWSIYVPGGGGIGFDGAEAAGDLATASASAGSTSTYTPTQTHHLFRLRLEATVSYRDRHGRKELSLPTPPVGPPDRGGTVSLSPSAPTAGAPLTATLSDADGGITGLSWRWHRRKPPSTSWDSIAAATDSLYTPVSADVDWRLRATARYGDSHGPNKTARGESASAVAAGVPGRPDSLRASVGNRQVILRWAAADSHGAWISGYGVRDSTSGGSWSGWTVAPGGGAARDTTVKDLTNGQRYWYEVRAGNPIGWGPADAVSAAPQVIRRPVITGRLRPSLPENRTDSVATYQAATASGTKIGWTLGGTDAAAFRTAGDTLYFKQPPDYEKPADAGRDNRYDLTLRAVDGVADTTVAVAVTVTDVNEPGTVTLSSSQPKVGRHLTASLTDPDGLKKGEPVTWTWHRLSSLTAAASTPALSTSYRYTVQAADLGQWLEARVSYTDRHGKATARDTTTSAVAADVPGAPGSLTATGGDRQVALSWTAAESNGSALTGYAYRDSTETTGPSAWKTLAGSTAATTRDTVTERTNGTKLANGTAYWLQLRAVNGVGDGAASAWASATPQAAGRPVIAGPLRPSFPENRTDSVATYRAATASGTKIGWTLGGADAAAFRAAGDTLYFKQAPDYEKPADAGKTNRYDLTLRAVAGSQDTTVVVRVTVTDVNEPGTVTLSSSQPKVGRHLTASLTDPDGLKKGESVTWTWHRLSSLTAAASPALSTSYRYTVQAADLGKWLEARVSYTDRHATATVRDTTTSAVAADVPGAPGSLTATAGDGQVVLQWTRAADRGSAITGYAYRDSSATSGKWSGWKTLAGSGAATTRATVTGLTNGRTYWFQVRAANGVGDGAASGRASATPSKPPDKPGSVSLSTTSPKVGTAVTATLSDGDGGIEKLTWTWSYFGVSATDTLQVTGPVTSSGLSTTLTPKASLVGNRLRADASYDDAHGTGKQAQSVKTSAVKASPPTPPRSLSAVAGHRQVELTWKHPASHGGAPVTRYEYQFKGSGKWSGWISVNLARKKTITGLTNGTAYNFRVRGVNGAGNGAVASASATPSKPPDKPGSVSLSTTSPKVGTAVTATLSDGDGGIEKLTWTWSYFGVSGTDSLRVTGPVASSGLSTTLTPKASVVGNRLRADASYDDDHGDGKQAQSAKTSAVKATTPTPPRSLSAAAGNRQVELTWKHPASHGGAPVTRYEYRSKGSGTWSGWTSVGLARKKTVTGLTNGTAYSFQVRAVNSAGPGGVASASATPFKPDTAGSVSLSTTSPKVGKALTATLTDADGGIKNLTWSWSSFGTSPADTLRVTGPVASSGLTSTLTPGTTLVGHRLRANASYDDAHGTGKQAQSAKTSAVKASPPGAPRSLSSSGHYGQVTLSWQAPASSGGATITGYQGRWKSDGSFNSWRSLGAGTARSYTVTNLPGGRTYTFEVRARNSAGPGAAASTSEVVPAARAKPAGLQALPDTVLAVLAAPNPFNAEITLHLQLPDEGPVHLTLYNMTGQRIRTLADGRRWEAGYHSLPWDGTDHQGRPATSGVYLFRLQAGAEVLVRKVVLIR